MPTAFHHVHIKSKTPRDTAAWWVDMFGATAQPEFDFGTIHFAPVVLDGVAMFASSRRGSFLGAVNINGRGALNGTKNELWTIDKATPDIPSLLLLGERLYYLSANTAVMTCVNARTGAVIAGRTRLGDLGSVYASPVAASGRIYVTGRDGRTLVMDEGLEILSENELGERVDATAALVGNQLLLRGEKHLFCFAAGSG